MNKEKKSVDVSLIVPNYNNGQFLEDFIRSVVNSTVVPRQLIIVDDGSTDRSVEILESFSHLDFLQVVRFEKNRGLTAALNAALDVAAGKYMMRADPDDELFPERIQRQFEYMEQHPGIDVLGCNVQYFDSITGKPVNKSNFPLTHQQIEKAYRRGEHGIQHPTAFVRGEVYRAYRYQPVFPGEDYEIFARMIAQGHRFANLPQTLYHMRIHPGSATGNLKIEHIRVTFRFRDEIFNTQTSNLKILFYYHYILNYRKYQSGKGGPFRYFYLLAAAAFYPAKLFKRLRK